MNSVLSNYALGAEKCIVLSSLVIGNVDQSANKKRKGGGELERGLRVRRVRMIDAVTYFLSSLPTALTHNDSFHRTQKGKSAKSRPRS